MSNVNYFAYGSNMLKERLTPRVKSATFRAIVALPGYRIRFRKKSQDCSGKCDIFHTHCSIDVVHGVIFEIDDSQLKDLDISEGCGHGYHREKIALRLADGSQMDAFVYLADPDAIDEALIPYSWYHELVIRGAEQHNLPKDYVAGLRAVPFTADPKPDRKTKRDAEEALKNYYSNRKKA